ncbi:MAG: aminotransferase class V-fold PLP-dependent enzyme [Pirellulales bacterium]|jgi:cysteine desulfurase/selenocysteine lyase
MNSQPVWNDFRQKMPITQKWAYFDHAAVAPLPEPSVKNIENWSNQAMLEGDDQWPNWAKQVESLRETSAKLIGANNEEIALIHNTTHGISIVSEGFDWQPGDNVVLLSNEFPSNLYPWMHLKDRGVEARVVQVTGNQPDLAQIRAAIDSRTRILSVSWVSYSTGYRLDLPQITQLAHEKGALLFLDAIQGLGVFPLDVHQLDIDFLAADGHKWMLGPEGAGIFYINKQHLDKIRPIGVGWNSVKHWHQFDKIELDLRDSATRFEGGSQNMVGMLALKASLELLTESGSGPRKSAVGDRVLEVTDLACERLQQAGAQIISDRAGENRSGIVVFDMPGKNPAELRRQCMRNGVNLSVRAGKLRISPHAYNNAEDIDRLIEQLTA